MKTAAIAGLLAVLAIGDALSAFAATRTVETSVDLELELWVDLQTSSAFVSTRQEGHEWITHDVRTALSRSPAVATLLLSDPVSLFVPVTVEVEVDAAPDEPVFTPLAPATPHLAPGEAPRRGGPPPPRARHLHLPALSTHVRNNERSPQGIRVPAVRTASHSINPRASPRVTPYVPDPRPGARRVERESQVLTGQRRDGGLRGIPACRETQRGNPHYRQLAASSSSGGTSPSRGGSPHQGSTACARTGTTARGGRSTSAT